MFQLMKHGYSSTVWQHPTIANLDFVGLQTANVAITSTFTAGQNPQCK
jgi:hypothetical protein